MSHEQAVKARATRETYLGNPNVKRDGVNEQWTQESILEYKRCMDDPIYFAEQYIKVISLDESISKTFLKINKFISQYENF